MKEYPFTQKEVDDLIGQDKYIKTGEIQPSRNKNQINAYRVSQPDSRLGLALRIQNMMVSLVWQGQRIRGIDYHEKKHRPDCQIIRGWHHHIFRKSYGDDWVECIDESHGRFSDRVELISDALERWHIKEYGNKELSQLRQRLFKF